MIDFLLRMTGWEATQRKDCVNGLMNEEGIKGDCTVIATGEKNKYVLRMNFLEQEDEALYKRVIHALLRGMM